MAQETAPEDDRWCKAAGQLAPNPENWNYKPCPECGRKIMQTSGTTIPRHHVPQDRGEA